ncbi:MAG: 4-hydroxy-tetrahydrodipicolinate reductase [Ruminococcaceae bacterium]|nr:4-hydroxy-tetrahydrodipicolinate reductase [Oscillospiraceae bacterium]
MNVILYGAGGRMGKEVNALIEASDNCTLCAAVDKISEDVALHDLADYQGDADVIIDFSHHSLTKEVIAYAISRSLPLVMCTTGHTEEEKALIFEAAKSIPVFYSANMSLGIATLCDFARRAAALFPDADIEIVEAHHNRKLDAPSGTALMIADTIKEVRPEAQYVFGRHGMAKRAPEEIGIHSLRCGNEPGMHEVIISTDYQCLSLKHNAESRAVFAEGALSAAKFINRRIAGLYNMYSLIDG